MVFGVVFGFGNMMCTVMAATSTTTIFGTRDYGTIYGFVTMAVSGGCAVGPMVSSAIYDGTGSYAGVWVLYAAMVIAVTAMVILAQRLMKKKLAAAE